MAYVVTATWTAREGEEERVLRAIENLVEPSRAERGCLYYQPCRDPENARVFFIFELYEDEAAYKAHGESEHFRRFGLEEAIPLLESRERRFYTTID
jgi:quinol monooxygenase YgiN